MFALFRKKISYLVAMIVVLAFHFLRIKNMANYSGLVIPEFRFLRLKKNLANWLVCLHQTTKSFRVAPV